MIAANGSAVRDFPSSPYSTTSQPAGAVSGADVTVAPLVHGWCAWGLARCRVTKTNPPVQRRTLPEFDGLIWRGLGQRENV